MCGEYCTQSQIEARLPALLLDDYEKKDRKYLILNEAMGWAAAQIDLHLGQYYPVPLSNVTDAVSHIAADLAAAFVLDSSYAGRGIEESSSLAKSYRDRAFHNLDHACKSAAGGGSGRPPVVDQSLVQDASAAGIHTRFRPRSILEDFLR